MKLTPRINPVALKELRQLVRSRLIIWGMAAMPAILLAITSLVLSSEMRGLTPAEVTYGKGLGEGTLTAATIVTGIVVCAAIPLFAAIKTVLETGKDNLGLEFTTTLTPAQIITGKITAVAMISAIAVALSMPFFVLSYLMRGVDLAATIVAPLALLASGVGLFSVALLPACARRPTAIRIILIVLIFSLVPTMTGMILEILSLVHGSPLGMSWLSSDYSFGTATATLLFLFVSLIAYCRAQAAAALAPQHLDFARPLRFTQAAIFAVGALYTLVEWEPWVVLSSIGAILIFLRAAYYPATLTRGARLHAPKSPFARLLAFPFATGSVPSMVFALIVTAIILPVPYICRSTDPGNQKFVVFVLEFCGLLMIAGSLGRLFVERRKTLAKAIGKAAFAYLVLVNVLCIVAEMDVFDKHLLYPMPCCIFGIDEGHHPLAAICLAAAGFALLQVVAFKDFRKFRKP